MKIKEILNEDVTDIVAHYYQNADPDFDKVFNSEDDKYKNENRDYYKKYFDSWYKNEITPVFKTPVDKPQKKYSNHPNKDAPQSPGYRGYNTALSKAGLPHEPGAKRSRTLSDQITRN